MMEDKELLLNAEIAFSNKRFSEALEWYRKVLVETPNDVYVLSRAGAICVSLNLFEDALHFFEKAKDLDSENGDNYFNYANACFFKDDYSTAFSMYVEAEQKGCSDDVTPRLYYQMAMLCSMREDVKSSLAYFKKSEEADKGGMIALNPDLISEKIKLFMLIQDYDNAEKSAAQLVAIQPIVFSNYMVYYSILMAHQKFNIAEKVLQDAEQYAEMTDDDRFALVLQKAALLMAIGEENGAEYYESIIDLLEGYYNSSDLSSDQRYEISIALAEVYLKAELYDKAISCLSQTLLPKESLKYLNVNDASESYELSLEEIDMMIEADMELIREKIDSGELDSELGMYAEIEYDEEGNERHTYPSSVFESISSASVGNASGETSNGESTSTIEEPSSDIKEKIYFTLLTAFLGKEDFAGALEFANILKHSENRYYTYYGIYTSTLIELKINGRSSDVERKYAETIAFFRNKTFENPNDVLASVFRARLYAEQGKFEKAKEIATLLSEDDRNSILNYIEQCQKSGF